jgi:hypothetical protein
MTFHKLLFAWMGLPAKAAAVREAITVAQVAAAIRDAGVNVSTDQVALLSDVVARTRAPALRVDSFGPWEGNLAPVRLECLTSDEGLPFVVTVRRSGTKNTEGGLVSSNPQPVRRSPVDPPKSKVVVRIGSAAVLLLDGGHVHIQLAVVCLENGAVGQTIRVTGRGHEHTYMAKVCSDGLLRGTL